MDIQPLVFVTVASTLPLNVPNHMIHLPNVRYAPETNQSTTVAAMPTRKVANTKIFFYTILLNQI